MSEQDLLGEGERTAQALADDRDVLVGPGVGFPDELGRRFDRGHASLQAFQALFEAGSCGERARALAAVRTGPSGSPGGVSL
jgi:hypothetical protein